MFRKCSYVLEVQKGDLQKFIYVIYEKLRKKSTTKNQKKNLLYCNKTKHLLWYNRICVLSTCKEDSAKKKRTGIPNIFDILSNFKIFLTGVQTTVFYVTTWKPIWTLRQNFPLKFVLAQK